MTASSPATDGGLAERGVVGVDGAVVAFGRGERRMPDRPEQHRVGAFRGGERVIGQRIAGGVDGGAADQLFLEAEAVAITGRDGAQDVDRRGGDFRSDAVAGQDDDVSVHVGTPDLRCSVCGSEGSATARKR